MFKQFETFGAPAHARTMQSIIPALCDDVSRAAMMMVIICRRRRRRARDRGRAPEYLFITLSGKIYCK